MNPPGSFDAFYAGYLAGHRHPANRALHLLAKLAVLAALGAAVGQASVLPLLAVPLLAVGPCWAGHLLFERNAPTAWTRPHASLLGTVTARCLGRAAIPGSRPERPWYSVAADLRMCLAICRAALGRGARHD
jgi:hypothetical protein